MKETIIIMLVIVIIILVFGVDFIECPECYNVPLVRRVCPVCGGDGNVTIAQYIHYYMSQNSAG